MNTLQISETVFNNFQTFVVQNREVTNAEAYKFVANARLRNMNDFNIARMVKVKVGNTITTLLDALTNN